MSTVYYFELIYVDYYFYTWGPYDMAFEKSKEDFEI